MVSLVAVGLIALPFELMIKTIPDTQHVTLIPVASLALIPLNIIDLIACGVVFVILAAFIIHRIFWPLLERPLYAAARYGLISRKKLLWLIGGILVMGPANTKSVLAWAVEKILSVK
jgi:hypothetical protein